MTIYRFLFQLMSKYLLLLLQTMYLTTSPVSTQTTGTGRLGCWHHHCDYGELQILCYRPLYTCGIKSGENPLESSLVCVRNGNSTQSSKPDLYCESDFISDCSCAHRRTGANGDTEPSDRTEHAYCKCEMNYRAKSMIVIAVVVLIMLVCLICMGIMGYIRLMNIKESLKIKARMRSKSVEITAPAFINKVDDATSSKNASSGLACSTDLTCL